MPGIFSNDRRWVYSINASHIEKNTPQNDAKNHILFFNESSVTSNHKRPVALVIHVLECESTVFVTSSPEYSLAFLLADAGIDVWLGNVRGTHYSLSHEYLSADNPEFWVFSWQEMAEYDLPAMVDWVISVTNQKQVYYIGHSQGTLVALTKMASDFNFRAKIRKSYLMAPFVTLQNIQSNVRKLLEFIDAGDTSEINQQFQPFINYCLKRLSAVVCKKPFVSLCYFVYSQFSGNSSTSNLESSRINWHFSHALSGTSLRNIKHFAQLHLSKKPRLFDHMNSTVNLRRYGSEEPPEVDVTNVHTPVSLFAGQNDASFFSRHPVSFGQTSKCVPHKQLLRFRSYRLHVGHARC